MDWLVDTNILIDHLRGVPKATTFLRQARRAGTLWLSAITFAEKQDLAGHLIWQLDMSASTERAKEIGRAIIGNLNEDGYLRATLEELQEMGGFSAEEIDQLLVRNPAEAFAIRPRLLR